MNIFSSLNKLIRKEEKELEIAHTKERIATNEVVQQYTANPQFPYLVSFSRTGSHWLRMLMEMYFKMPSLKLLFFQNVEETTTYSCFHTHDLELNVKAKNVIYLYRDPVDTLFSQMSYHAQDLRNENILEGWLELYANHLNKWLVIEKFTSKKTVLRYEILQKNIELEFLKLCQFFDVPFNPILLKEISTFVSKEKIKEKTQHDPRVINLNNAYSVSRNKFREIHSEKIYKGVFEKYPQLKAYFD